MFRHNTEATMTPHGVTPVCMMYPVYPVGYTPAAQVRFVVVVVVTRG